MRKLLPADLGDVFMPGYGFVHPELVRLMAVLETAPDSFCVAGRVPSGQYTFIGAAIESVLGHSCEYFLERGSRALYSLTTPECFPGIARAIAHYIKQSYVPGYNTSEPNVWQLDLVIRSASGRPVPFIQWGIFLGFIPWGPRLDFFVSSVYATEGKSESEILQAKELICRLLTAIKEKYVTLYPEKMTTFDPAPNTMVKTAYPIVQDIQLTTRETDVLHLIGRGYSTKEMAGILCISFHTVEDYRKSLLEKFTARNSAHLIQKASKVYWLE